MGYCVFEPNMWTIATVLLSLIPGVFGYDYNVGGLAAASAACVLLLLPIIAMFVVIVRWRDWYMKKQARRGRFRVPRKDWTTFTTKSKPKSIVTVVSTPKSERRANLIRLYDIQGQPEPHNNTLTKTAQGDGNAYTHFSRTRTPARYEEKIQTINFEPEEEAVIVADVLPDETKRPVVHSLSQTQPARPYYIETQTQEVPSDMRTTVIGMNQPQTQHDLRTSARPDYHIKYEHVTRSSKDGDIFISPIVPMSNTSITDDDAPLIRSTTSRQTHENEAVMIFNDDEEVGNEPSNLRNTRVDVMY